MIKRKRLSFAHLEGDICVYNLTKGDKEYLKRNGLKKIPSILQSVEFGSLGKLYQGFGIQNDMGGVEFFHPDYTKNPVTLRACGITTVLNPKVKDTQVCCVFYDFMDYLAYCSLQGSAELRLPYQGTCIIMSHVKNFMHMVVDSDDYDEVYVFFPNTVVGETIALTLKQRNQKKVKNFSIFYKGYRNLCSFVKDKHISSDYVF